MTAAAMARVWSFALVVAVLGTTLANDQAGEDGCSGIFEDLLGVGLDPKSFDSGAVYAAHLDDISDAASCVKACCGNGQCSLALLDRTGARARCHLVNCVAEGTGADACIATPNAAYDSYRKREGDSRSSNDDEEKCHAPIKVGPCRAAFPSFNYDPVNQTCREFIYGGCEGNANNYDSREECERTCAGVRADEASPNKTLLLSKRMAGPMKLEDPTQDTGLIKEYREKCHAPIKVGPCRAAFPSFNYDPVNQTCREFIYGGCEGNANNYDSREECERTCAGVRADEASPNTLLLSKRMAGPMKLEDPTQDTGLIKEYRDSCEVAPVVGPCEALMWRFFYNSTSGSCQHFIYGGCRGNDNNYRTQAECQAKCSADEASPNKTLLLSKRMAGPMKLEDPAQDTGLIKEYRDSCEVAPVVENRLPAHLPVMKPASAQYKDHCLAQKEVGPCRAAFPSWYYNSATQDCLPFIYGGCEGNLNRYSSAQDCMRRCAGGPEAHGEHHRHGFLNLHTGYVLTAVLAVVIVILVMGLIFIRLRKARECHLLVVDDKEELLPSSRSEKA